ncbi:MAG: RDD family protein [Lautropia sp.]|nr:RDD family protein [Lautropia sp.]
MSAPATPQPEPTPLNAAPPSGPATTWRRLMCVVYEAIILFGVIFFFGYAFSALTQFTGAEGWLRTTFQGFMFLVLGAYFSWFWSQGRWSLPMKTIGVKLVRHAPHETTQPTGSNSHTRADSSIAQPPHAASSPAHTGQAVPTAFQTVSLGRAAWRYTLASAMFWGGLALVWKASPWWLPLFFLPFFWSVFDRQRRTLYDVLAGTMLITVENRGKKRRT